MIDFDQALVPCLIALIIIPQIPWAFLCRYKTKEVKWLESMADLFWRQSHPCLTRATQEPKETEKKQLVTERKANKNMKPKGFRRGTLSKEVEAAA